MDFLLCLGHVLLWWECVTASDFVHGQIYVPDRSFCQIGERVKGVRGKMSMEASPTKGHAEGNGDGAAVAKEPRLPENPMRTHCSQF